MSIPLIYNLESIRVRWRTNVVAVLGIAGAVGVFVAMLALVSGFRAALTGSGDPANALIRRQGANSEVDSVVTLNQLRALESATEVARDAEGPLISPEALVVTNLPLRKTGRDANLMLRGVTPRALVVHRGVRVAEGRFFQPGLHELVVGSNATQAYTGLALGDTVKLGSAPWQVVGVMDAGGSSFDSELWCDATLLSSTFHHLPPGNHSSVALRLASPDAIPALKARMDADPRLQCQVELETDYYAKSSEMMTGFILSLGAIVALVMGLGAVFAALNTMYSAVAERTREVATIRALGFGGGSVVLSFVFEALLVSLAGGLVGCLAVLPLNGMTTATLNFQTFSRLSFAFQVTPLLLGLGIAFALLMGLAGGVPPAFRAARLPLTAALRDL
jgi:putative ABC transport system permease protein